MSYSSEFNLKKEKCLSCQHYSGCHGISGGLMGSRIQYEPNGICNKKGAKYPENTSSNRWCSKWIRDSRISQVIADQERKEFERKNKYEYDKSRRENERQESELRKERYRIESERRTLEEERKKLEYERWYGSLSPEDKQKEDNRVEEEKRLRQRHEEELRIQLEEEKRTKEEQKRIKIENSKKEKKKVLITLTSIAGVIALTITGIVVGSKVKANLDYKNSSTGKFLSFLENCDGYENGTLSQYVDINTRGRVYFNLEYVKNGWHDPWNKTYDFRTSVILPPKAGETYTQVFSSMCFNLDGSDNKDSFVEPATPYNRNPNYSAKVTYTGGYVVLTYDYVTYNSSANEITYRTSFYSDTTHDTDGGFHKTEWSEAGWVALSTGFIWVNDLFHQATGQNLYK